MGQAILDANANPGVDTIEIQAGLVISAEFPSTNPCPGRQLTDAFVGTFTESFDPLAYNDEYIEGNSWQYTWFVLHDVDFLIEGMGGKEAFIQKLDGLYTTETPTEDLPVFITGREIARWEGALFLAYYMAYVAWLVLAAQHNGLLGTYSTVMMSFVLPLTLVTLVVMLIRREPPR